MNSLVWKYQTFVIFFFLENGKTKTYEPDDDQIAVLNLSVPRPHLA